jgi:uncharacterized OB-fold protein
MMGKPAPVATSDTIEFWNACNRDELLYQCCVSCGHVQFYPRPFCTQCHSNALESRASKGRGAVYSFTVVHRSANRAFDDDVPFVLALVDLDEGFRVMTNIVGEGRLTASIGDRVRFIFERRSSNQKIPQAVLSDDP